MAPHRCLAAFPLLAVASAGYSESRAIEYAKLAGAAYCSKKSLETWSCGKKCSAKVSDVTVCTGDHIQAFVGVWEQKCLVSFEGTNDGHSLVKDLEFFKSGTEWDICDNCKVHGGFLAEYKSLEQCVKTALVSTGCPKGSDIRTTGHSLGAACNAMAMLDLTQNGWTIEESYDFGKPRTGDSTFAAAFNGLFKGKSWRVTHHADPVPNLPPDDFIVNWRFEHTEPEIYYAGNVSGGYIECLKAHDNTKCVEHYWNIVSDLLLHVNDHLDYMGVDTGSAGCEGPDCLSDGNCLAVEGGRCCSGALHSTGTCGSQKRCGCLPDGECLAALGTASDCCMGNFHHHGACVYGRCGCVPDGECLHPTGSNTDCCSAVSHGTAECAGLRRCGVNSGSGNASVV